MEQALTRMLAACALLGLATATAAQPFRFVNPNVAGGYKETRPGPAHPFTLENPNGAGGYTAITPGRSQPFTFINPNGYTLLTPGQSFGLAVKPPQPPLTRSYGDDN